MVYCSHHVCLSCHHSYFLLRFPSYIFYTSVFVFARYTYQRKIKNRNAQLFILHRWTGSLWKYYAFVQSWINQATLQMYTCSLVNVVSGDNQTSNGWYLLRIKGFVVQSAGSASLENQNKLDPRSLDSLRLFRLQKRIFSCRSRKPPNPCHTYTQRHRSLRSPENQEYTCGK